MARRGRRNPPVAWHRADNNPRKGRKKKLRALYRKRYGRDWHKDPDLKAAYEEGYQPISQSFLDSFDEFMAEENPSRPRLANWTGYPEYIYDQFYRANPRRGERGRLYRQARIFYWGDTWETSDVFLRDDRPGFKRAMQQTVAVLGEPTGFIWTSRNNPDRMAGWSQRMRRVDTRKMPVPRSIRRTSREAAEGLYVFPRERSFPIGDLYHAKLALIYAMSPSHKSRRQRVLQAVIAYYPKYAWKEWFLRKMAEKRARKRRARKNPSAAAARAKRMAVPMNAGPYTPGMYPYGSRGVSYEYDF